MAVNTSKAAHVMPKRAWGVTDEVFINTDARSLTPVILLLAITVGFNKSIYARDFYGWLNSNYTPFQINTGFTFAITTAVYWVYGGLYAIADLTERPRWLQKYKIQPYHRVTGKQYIEICKIVLRNQLLVSLPLTIAFGLIPSMGDTRYETLPGFRKTLLTYVFCLLCEEAGFYYVHRALHAPGRYARFHKMHHTFTAPTALAATYCTMTEHVLSNLLPIIAGHIILGSHWSMVVFFFCSLTMGTLDTHSGYNIPCLSNSLRHDYHHYSYLENFGPTGLLDSLHHTNTKFKKALADAVTLHHGDRRAANHHLATQMAQVAYEEDASAAE